MLFNIILVGSTFGLLPIALSLYFKTRNLRLLIAHLFAVAIVAAILTYAIMSPRAVARGDENNNLPFVIALYVCMLAGMFANHGYNRWSQPQKNRRRFDWGVFVAPMLASPIVFIPLLGAMQSSQVDLDSLSTPKLMVFLVAFQNGFFWKEFFDNLKQKAT